MPSLIRKEAFTCEKGGAQTTRNNILRHKKNCSAGTLYCTHSPNVSTKCHKDLNYNNNKKHSAPKLGVIFKCKHCYQQSLVFYAVHHRKNTESGFHMKTANVDPDDILSEFDDANLKRELLL